MTTTRGALATFAVPLACAGSRALAMIHSDLSSSDLCRPKVLQPRNFCLELLHLGTKQDQLGLHLLNRRRCRRRRYAVVVASREQGTIRRRQQASPASGKAQWRSPADLHFFWSILDHPPALGLRIGCGVLRSELHSGAMRCARRPPCPLDRRIGFTAQLRASRLIISRRTTNLRTPPHSRLARGPLMNAWRAWTWRACVAWSRPGSDDDDPPPPSSRQLSRPSSRRSHFS